MANYTISSSFTTEFDTNEIFSIYRDTGDFQAKLAFKEIKEVPFLSYYSAFRFLLCDICHISIQNPKSHISIHLNDYNNNHKRITINKVFNIYNTLKIESFDKNLILIDLFKAEFNLYSFPELEIKTLFQCSICKTIKFNKKNIKKHISSIHKNILESNTQDYINNISGQGLLSNRFFFEVQIKDKNSVNLNNNVSEPIILNSNESISINDSDNSNLIENPIENNIKFNLIKSKWEKDFNKKLEILEKKGNSTKVGLENLTPFQERSKYLSYISKFNSKDLVDLLKINDLDPDLEKVITLILSHLEELLYISLEKITLLNKSHLNILNSFEFNKIKNKGLKPLNNSQSRIKYFNFFKSFFIFLINCSFFNNNKYYSDFNDISRYIHDLINLSLDLIEKDNEDIEKFKSHLNRIKKSTSKNITLKISNNKLDDLESTSNKSISTSSEHSNDISDSESNSSSSSSNNSNNSNKSINENNIIDTFNKINESSSDISSKIKEKLLIILIKCFQQKTDLNIFISPINCFFAIKSIRENNFSIKNTLDLAQYYSQFIYCTQLLVSEYSIRILLKNPLKIDLNLILTQFMDLYFKNSSQTALAEILLNRSFCFKVNSELSNDTQLIISNLEPNTLSYKDVTISVDNIKLLFKTVLNETYSYFLENLLLGLNPNEFNHITLKDFSKYEDRSINAPFKSFKDFHPEVKSNDKFLINKVVNNEKLRDSFFIISNNNLILNKDNYKLFLRKVLKFKKLLLLLIHLTGGLPSRGTELTSLRFQNSIKDLRELFLDTGSALFITNISKYKSQSKSEKQASNIKYLPSKVSEILLFYIVLVNPFINSLNICNTKFDFKLVNPYLFYINQRYLASSDLSYILKEYSERLFSINLNLQKYRQLIVGIIREFMKENINLNTLNIEEDESFNYSSIKANQMNHSINTENLHYGRTSTSFKNIRMDLQSKYLEFCLRYHEYFDLNSGSELINPYIQSLKVKNQNYLNQNNLKINSLILKYFKEDKSSGLNPRKHNLFGSSNSINTSDINDSKVVRKLTTKDFQQISNISSSSNILNELLREFLNNSNATFRIPQQEDLIKSIFLKIPYILGVLPTNSGKSLSYLLTSALKTSKVTIVIIPLIALKSDILNRAKSFNIPCSIWEDDLEVKNLTLVSIESIIKDSFRFMINNLINDNRLDRFIIDECHLLITSANYRNIMYRFKSLLKVKSQFIFLTGTLPFSIESKLIDYLSLKDLSIIRAPCTRNNIKYKSKIFDSSDSEIQYLEIQDYIENFKLTSFLSEKDKIIIFCTSKSEVLALASYLNCSFYTSDLTEKEKIDTLNAFFNTLNNFYNIIVCTSALEEGIDYSNIRLVIYIRFCWSFIGFLQGSSRGGRDLNSSESIFFYNKSEENDKLSDINSDRLELRKYLRETICKRRVIDLYLDNIITENCLPNQELCDLCYNRSKIMNNQVNFIKEKEEEIRVNRSLLTKSLENLFINNCWCCLISFKFHINSSDIISHRLKDCSYWLHYSNSNFISVKIKEFNDLKIDLIPDTCCFKCLFPTKVCSVFKRKNNSIDCFFSKSIFISICDFLWEKRRVIKKELLESSNNNEFLVDFFNNSNMYNKYNFTKKFFSKVRIEEINTESIYGFWFIVYGLDLKNI